MLNQPTANIAALTNVTDEINLLLNRIGSEGRPFAVWKMPERDTVHLVAAFAPQAELHAKVDLETLPAGFVAAPFDTARGIYFIPADEHWIWKIHADSGKGERLKGWDILLPDSGDLPERLSVARLKSYLTTAQVSGSSAESFQNAVRAAVDAVKRHEFQKVVLSRQKQVPLPPRFDFLALFVELCRRYPTAFVSFFAVPQAGVWIGASPEILVGVENNRIFRTMALAGTQPRGALENLQQAAWTQKEIAEQAMVSRYIINCFKKIRLREFEEDGPRTVAAGNLIHLRTDFEVDMQAVNFPQLGTVMLELLHPTSAVCGLPKEPAAVFIARHENYDRALYSGYIGSVNIEGESRLFVNLRCMQLQANSLILYAGAGITEDSDAEKEWRETEMKCDTMLDAVASIGKR